MVTEHGSEVFVETADDGETSVGMVAEDGEAATLFILSGPAHAITITGSKANASRRVSSLIGCILPLRPFCSCAQYILL